MSARIIALITARINPNQFIFFFLICKIGIQKSRSMIVIKTVRLWVKSWFFDVESKKEYLCSKSLFNKWLGFILAVISAIILADKLTSQI